MEIVKIKCLTEKQFQQIDNLWNEEFPVELKDRFKILLDDVKNFTHYLIEDETKRILAWAGTFEKDNEIRFSIIVGYDQQGQGLGSLLLNRLKEDLDEFYGWVIDHNNSIRANGEYYQSPLSFYVKEGFEVLQENRIESELIKAVKIRKKRTELKAEPLTIYKNNA